MDNEMLGAAGDAADLPTVELHDEAGRSLKCYVERTMQIEGKEYLLLMPVDAPIEIFAWEEDEEDDEAEVMRDVEDDEIEEIFDTAKAVLAELNLTLKHTAYTLTVTGELPEPQEENVITLEMEEDEEDEFQRLTSFFYEEQEYDICTPYTPLLFFARRSAKGTPELLPPDDFHLMRSQLEDKLFDALDD
jgi:hypothetical protein